MKKSFKIAVLAGVFAFGVLLYRHSLPTGFSSARVSQTAAPAVAVGTASRPLDPGFVLVDRVVDGDTIDVLEGGKVVRVRFIGINTPETVDPRKPVECFGPEASKKMHALLDGAEVRLETDPSQSEYDKYGRLLAYVFLPDGTDVNELMIREGYAHEYTYKKPYKFQKEFRAYQAAAKALHLGLWNVCY